MQKILPFSLLWTLHLVRIPFVLGGRMWEWIILCTAIQWQYSNLYFHIYTYFSRPVWLPLNRTWPRWIYWRRRCKTLAEGTRGFSYFAILLSSNGKLLNNLKSSFCLSILQFCIWMNYQGTFTYKPILRLEIQNSFKKDTNSEFYRPKSKHALFWTRFGVMGDGWNFFTIILRKLLRISYSAIKVARCYISNLFWVFIFGNRIFLSFILPEFSCRVSHFFKLLQINHLNF